MSAMALTPFRRPVFLFLICGLLLALAACSSDEPPPVSRATEPSVRALPTLTPLPPQRKGQGVILVTLAGARADLVAQYMSDGAVPTLARMASLGAQSEHLLPVEPALGAITQMTLLTGAGAPRTGITADLFRKNGQPIGQNTEGLETVSNVEPIWRSAMRFGARAALIGYPSPLTDVATQRADWQVSAGAAIAPSAQHLLKFAEAKDWKGAPSSFSPLKEARTVIAQGADAAPAELFVLAMDTTDDRQENYDTWLLSRRKAIDESVARLRLNEWARYIVDPMLQSAIALKVTDANPANFLVYQSPVMVNHAAPLELAREITRQLGAPPAPPDREALARNWIDEGTYLQMSERQSDWLASAALYVYRQYKPDLLILRLTTTEDVGRHFLLTQSRQLRYAERRQFYASALRRGYEVADNALARLYVQLDFNTNALIVASPNGLAPAHTTVNLNRLLADRKWLTWQGGAVPDYAKSKAYAEANDGIAHIYISLKGRDPNGTVEPGEYDKLQNEIIGALNELNDPIDGQPVLARVLRKTELNAIGWHSDHGGDVVVQARPGFVFSSARERSAVLEPAAVLGASGYQTDLPDLRGIFVAYGAGIRGGARLSPVRALDVAPTIAALLRFPPPPFVEGKAMEGVLR